MNYIRSWYNSFKSSFSRCLPGTYRHCERWKGPLKFLLAGLAATIVNLLALDIFYRRLHWEIVPATSAAFVVAFLVSFYLQKFWTFRDKSQDRIAGQFTAYLVNGLVGLYFNGFLMHLLVENYGFPYLISQLAVNVVIATQNFLVYRIIFKKRHGIVNQQEKIS